MDTSTDINFLRDRCEPDTCAVVIDGARRDRTAYPDPAEFVVNLKEPLKLVYGYDILDATIPSTIHNVSPKDNKVAYYVFGGQVRPSAAFKQALSVEVFRDVGIVNASFKSVLPYVGPDVVEMVQATFSAYLLGGNADVGPGVVALRTDAMGALLAEFVAYETSASASGLSRIVFPELLSSVDVTLTPPPLGSALELRPPSSLLPSNYKLGVVGRDSSSCLVGPTQYLVESNESTALLALQVLVPGISAAQMIAFSAFSTCTLTSQLDFRPNVFVYCDNNQVTALALDATTLSKLADAAAKLKADADADAAAAAISTTTAAVLLLSEPVAVEYSGVQGMSMDSGCSVAEKKHCSLSSDDHRRRRNLQNPITVSMRTDARTTTVTTMTFVETTLRSGFYPTSANMVTQWNLIDMHLVASVDDLTAALRFATDPLVPGPSVECRSLARDYSPFSDAALAVAYREFAIYLPRSTMSDLVGFGNAPQRALVFSNRYGSLSTPGVVSCNKIMYVVLRCKEIEENVFREDVAGASGIGVFKILDSNSIVNLRYDFVNFVSRPFHPISQLTRLTLRFENIDGSLCNFNGSPVLIILGVKRYMPQAPGNFGTSYVLNPNYNPDFHEYRIQNMEMQARHGGGRQRAALPTRDAFVREHNLHAHDPRRRLPVREDIEDHADDSGVDSDDDDSTDDGKQRSSLASSIWSSDGGGGAAVDFF